MRLYEHEGKDLLESAGIATTERVLVDSPDDLGKIGFPYPVVVKAQVLSGKRWQRGLIQECADRGSVEEFVKRVVGNEFDGEVVERVLVERKVDIAKELFVSFTYSTVNRGAVLLCSSAGGVEVESKEDQVVQMPLNGVSDLQFHDGYSILTRETEKDVEIIKQLNEVVVKLWELFRERDLFLVEINPLVVTGERKVVAVDAKVVTDDAAAFRQKWDLKPRNMLGRAKTETEAAAEEIDREDHRGVVGRVYLDLPGDIGVIAAGGGASLVAMDAMMSYGLSPANYTEFSGNPPAWKVKRLSEIVMGKKGLKGLMLVGGKANFTDQVETLSGFAEAVKEARPTCPIIVRRDGPRMKEAKEMLESMKEELGLNMEVVDASVPIVEAVGMLARMVGEKKEEDA